MCQLTLANLNSQTKNRMLILTQLNENSLRLNKDGTGFFCVTSDKTNLKYRLFKFRNPPHLITNWGEIVSDIQGNRPVIGHVRLATAYNKQKTVDDEKAHPFMSPEKTFVLAHNGSLEPTNKDIKDNELFKDMIDTEIFVHRLEELRKQCDGYEKGSWENMIEALQVTMKEFTGKFAFLIYDFLSDKHFIVRGSSAPLHISYIHNENSTEHLGFVINTDKDSLENNLKLWKSITNLTAKTKVEYTDPEEVEKESIFLVEKTSINKVGNMEENSKFRSGYQANNGYEDWYGYGYTHNRNVRTTPSKEQELITLGMRIAKGIKTSMMDLISFEILVEFMFKKPLISLSEKDFQTFNIFLELLISEAEEPMGKGFGKKTKSRAMKRYLDRIDRWAVTPQIYEENPGLLFPWMITGSEVISKIEIASRKEKIK